MPSWAFAALDEWAAAAGITSGPVLRPVSKGGFVGSGSAPTTPCIPSGHGTATQVRVNNHYTLLLRRQTFLI